MKTYLSDKQRIVLGTTFRDDLSHLPGGGFRLAGRVHLTGEPLRADARTRRGARGARRRRDGARDRGRRVRRCERYGGIGPAYETLVDNPNQTEDMGQRFASLDMGFREDYWSVGWEAWKEHP